MREIITITIDTVLDHALNEDFHTDRDNMRLDQRQMKLHERNNEALLCNDKLPSVPHRIVTENS